MNDGSECQNTRTLRGLWRAGVTARASFANIPMNIGRFANYRPLGRQMLKTLGHNEGFRNESRRHEYWTFCDLVPDKAPIAKNGRPL